MSQQYNGRINIKSPNTSALFQMYDKIPANQCVTYRNATEGLWDNTPLSDAYFSKDNLQIVQNGIRAGVYRRSNGQYVIGVQDYVELKKVMRSIFLQYAANQPDHIPQQIEQLNKMVIDFCVQTLYSEAQAYMKYLDDASTLVVPIAPPVQSSNTDRTLEFKGWF